MRRSMSRLLIGLFVAPLALASSAALAADPCGNIDLAATGKCELDVTGGCESRCTPLNFTLACDGQCGASADVSCTGGCEADCNAKCTPGSIDCEGSCTTSCHASCMSSCNGDTGCQSDCDASCDGRCGVACEANPPSCQASCQAACDASCKAQVNFQCDAMCTSTLTGGCQTQCQDPRGALFCDGQYIDVTDLNACIAELTTRGLYGSIGGSCTAANGCNITTGIGCSASPAGVGAVDTRYGVGAMAGLMVGLGMIVSRRRRKA